MNKIKKKFDELIEKCHLVERFTLRSSLTVDELKERLKNILKDKVGILDACNSYSLFEGKIEEDISSICKRFIRYKGCAKNLEREVVGKFVDKKNYREVPIYIENKEIEQLIMKYSFFFGCFMLLVLGFVLIKDGVLDMKILIPFGLIFLPYPCMKYWSHIYKKRVENFLLELFEAKIVSNDDVI